MDGIRIVKRPEVPECWKYRYHGPQPPQALLLIENDTTSVKRRLKNA